MTSKQIVLITGANQGIGFEIAKKLATEQLNYHILIGARSISNGEEAAKLLAHLPGSVQAIQLDVTSDDSIAACVAYIEKEFGILDVLINNAGIASPALQSESTLRGKLARCLDTNVYGAACLTESCISLLRRAENPRIVFVSSEMGSIGNALDPNFPYYGVDSMPYKTSKAAMNMMGATYAVKYQKEGFKVNMHCPGLRNTNMNKTFGGMGGPPSGGAVNACRLATLGKDGETGTFTNSDGVLPW